MIRQTVAHVDLDAIRSNFRAIVQFLESLGRPPSPGVIAVVKANAYGHGAAEVGAGARAGRGRDARLCRHRGRRRAPRRPAIAVPILVFGALSVSDLDGLFTHDLTPTISTPGRRAALEAAAARHGVRLRCHLKIDTGMNRLGFRHDNLARTLPRARGGPQLEIDAVYTHFATADDPEHPAFARAARAVRGGAGAAAGARASRPPSGTPPTARRCCATSASGTTSSVPGLLLYGIVPPPLAATLALRPALSLRSRIVAVKGIRPGEGIGYGLRGAVDRPVTLAVVPAGYADGLDTRLAGRGDVLVRGRRAPIVGSVCMDMTMIDVTGTDVAPGDEVVIVGEQDDESHRRPRDRGHDRDDSVRAAVPRRRADRAGLFMKGVNCRPPTSNSQGKPDRTSRA